MSAKFQLVDICLLKSRQKNRLFSYLMIIYLPSYWWKNLKESFVPELFVSGTEQ
jgi:hypothetical protein